MHALQTFSHPLFQAGDRIRFGVSASHSFCIAHKILNCNFYPSHETPFEFLLASMRSLKPRPRRSRSDPQIVVPSQKSDSSRLFRAP